MIARASQHLRAGDVLGRSEHPAQIEVITEASEVYFTESETRSSHSFSLVAPAGASNPVSKAQPDLPHGDSRNVSRFTMFGFNLMSSSSMISRKAIQRIPSSGW